MNSETRAASQDSFEANEPLPVVFPCDRCPEEPRAARLLGLYGQVQEGLLMQRVKVHTGRISAAQWRAVAAVAEHYANGYPLHLTTRQDIELHGLWPEDVPAVQRELATVGLSTVGACGDTLRNVTACPANGIEPGTVDVADVADLIRRAAESLPCIQSLPRKFKISVSGCEEGCARPWINDLGLVANSDGTFRAIVGGSLGARPGVGVALYERLGLSDLVPLTVATLRLFNAEGDRQNRTRARLRHVRERLGDEAFRAQLDELFAEARQKSTWPVPQAGRVEGTSLRTTRLHLSLGDIEAERAIALADLAERTGATLRIGFEHDLHIYHSAALELPAELRALAGGPSIVACPGSSWCTRGITDSRAVAMKLRQALAGSRANLCIGISGCPNNCSQAAVADIGLVGRVKNVDGSRLEAFRLLAGGERGMGPALAEELHGAVPANAVPEAVSWLLEQYLNEEKSGGKGFCDFVRREKPRLTAGLQWI